MFLTDIFINTLIINGSVLPGWRYTLSESSCFAMFLSTNQNTVSSLIMSANNYSITIVVSMCI